MEAFRAQAISSSSSSSSSSPTSSPLWVSPAAALAAAAGVGEREHMFDKVVTPSDVGKLNRLVIPKQYAERFFPLDPTMADKGLELSFEDRAGKQWSFRYSYWNSSQSYVMTKGWSRFVKEKRLDAGDTVSFFRARDGSAAAEQAASSAAPPPMQHRLFIDLQHRKHYPSVALFHHLSAVGRRIGPWAGLIPSSSSPSPQPLFPGVASAADAGISRLPCFYYRSMGLPPHVAVVQAAAAAGGGDGGVLGVPMVLDSVPVILGAAAKTKRVRLFGVNLECPEPPEDGSRGTGQLLPSSVQPTLLQWTTTTATAGAGAGADESTDDNISSKNIRPSTLPPPLWTPTPTTQ